MRLKLVTGDVFHCVFLCCPFLARAVMDEFWDLIESVSEGCPTYSYNALVLSDNI